MGADARKRQKKLERRSARRKEKKHQISRRQSVGLAERLTAAAGYPVLDCWVSDSLEAEGLGQIGLSRQLPDGSVAVASFLVDRFCLGVKDAHSEILPRTEYDEIYRRQLPSRLPSRPIPPADARKVVEAAVAYARLIGFAPHADYARAKLLFGSIDPAEGKIPVEFGKDGQPLFISGPNDSLIRCRQIVDTLTKTCGPGKFEYVIGVGSASLDDNFDREGLPALDEWGDEDE